MDENILRRLKSVKALATRGANEAERKAADDMYNKLIKKYNIDESMIPDEDKINEYSIHIRNDEDKTLLIQIAYKVTNNPGTVYTLRRQRSIRNTVLLKCTEAQKIEIEFLFEFYKELYDREKKYFMKAFVHKHNLYGEPIPSDDNNTPDPLSRSELFKISQLMNSMDDANVRKALDA